MGYTNPKIIINESNKEINKQISNFNNYVFSDLMPTLHANEAKKINDNLAKLEEVNLKQKTGLKAWHDAVDKNRPQGGYKDEMQGQLNMIKDEFYEAYMSDDPEAYSKMRELLLVPQQISETRGAVAEIQRQGDEASTKEKGTAGAFNAINDPNMLHIATRGNSVPVWNSNTRQMEYKMLNQDGSDFLVGGKPQILSGVDFTRNIMSGEAGLQTYGDPSAKRKEFWSKGWKDADGDNMYTSLIDGRDPTDKKEWKNFTEFNGKFKETMKNPLMYEKLFNNSEAMRNDWPVIVNDLSKSAAAGNKEALDALGPILGGADGVYDPTGGAQSKDDMQLDDFYANQAKSGGWTQSDDQTKAAMAYYTTYDDSLQILKEDRLVKETLSPEAEMSDELKYKYAKLRFDKEKFRAGANADNETKEERNNWAKETTTRWSTYAAGPASGGSKENWASKMSDFHNNDPDGMKSILGLKDADIKVDVNGNFDIVSKPNKDGKVNTTRLSFSLKPNQGSLGGLNSGNVAKLLKDVFEKDFLKEYQKNQNLNQGGDPDGLAQYGLNIK